MSIFKAVVDPKLQRIGRKLKNLKPNESCNEIAKEHGRKF